MIHNRQHKETVVLDETDDVGGDIIKPKARSIIKIDGPIFPAHNYPSSSYVTFLSNCTLTILGAPVE